MGWGPEEEEDAISGGGGRTVILQFIEREVLGTLFIEMFANQKAPLVYLSLLVVVLLLLVPSLGTSP